MPLALILLANQIRAEAPDTFQYFDRQGVTVKVISGDNPITVSEVAKRADIPNADRFVDARHFLIAAVQDNLRFGVLCHTGFEIIRYQDARHPAKEVVAPTWAAIQASCAMLRKASA